MKTQIKATTYKDIPKDLNEDMSYIDFEKGEKYFNENELKWFVKFHNMKRDSFDVSQTDEYYNYLKMMAIMTLGRRYDLGFEIDTRKGSMFGYYEHFGSAKKGVKIAICPKALYGYSYEGRESLHQKALSTIRHEMCHWHLHTIGEKGYKDGDKEFEEMLLKVNADSSFTYSVAESKRVQQAHINGTFKRTTLHYDITMKKVPLSKTQINEEIFETAYEIKDINTNEHISYIAKAKNGLFIPISDEYEQSYTSKFGKEDYSNIASAKRGFRQRKDALSSLMNLTGR